MPMMQIGDTMPNVLLPIDNGKTMALSGFKGQKAVLFFYPKADTSGCTQEAKDFSALAASFAKAKTALVGISPDPVAALNKFKIKHALTITLASDEKKILIESWGLWIEKSLYGRKYMGVDRTTVLIDAKGVIARIWPKVKVEGHAAEVLGAAQDL